MTTLNADNVKVGANSISVIGQMTAPLPALIDRAATVLAEAKSAAEVLEACEMASVAYDKAKTAARLAKAKQAHDDLIAAIYSAQGDAMMIEAQAKQRLADEYDAAQVRGEVASGRDGPGTGVLNGNAKATAADIGLTRKDIHDARMVRDAEAADPGVVRRAVDEAVAAGREPTKAMMRRAVKKVVQRGKSKLQKKMSSTKAAEPSPALKETQHDRDIRVLFSLWDASCASAREEFQSKLPEMVNLKQRIGALETELQQIRDRVCDDDEPAEQPVAAQPETAKPTSGDDLDIPEFLRRPITPTNACGGPAASKSAA